MIDAKQIPDEVVEAAAMAMWRTDDPTAWEKMMAATAIFAAVDAWPGADQYLGAVVLPLPQKEKGGQ